MAQHFTKKVNHTPTKPPTEQEVKDFLAGKLIVTPESILEKNNHE
jgi:hypothetical protein